MDVDHDELMPRKITFIRKEDREMAESKDEETTLKMIRRDILNTFEQKQMIKERQINQQVKENGTIDRKKLIPWSEKAVESVLKETREQLQASVEQVKALKE